jgi:hypothetical protein
MKIISRLLLSVLLLQILNCCTPRINIRKINRSSVSLKSIQFETVGRYPEPVVKFFMKKLKSPEKINITSGIELFRVTYTTKDENDKEVVVSGLLAIPRNKKIKGVVSYQHGTNSERSEAPSKPSQDEGLGMAAIFAGGGYLTLIPDYIGFGVSTEVHTYLHAATTVNAVVDFLKIGTEICNSITGKQTNSLFLVGISQGGHATAAVHRYIEQNPIKGLNLVATSSIVGAYNLKEISIPYAVENNSVFYLGYLANAYCHIYNMPLSSIIVTPYDTVVSRLFNGNYGYRQIVNRLPKTADGLYTKEILSDLKTGNSVWFTDKLAENQTYDWKPKALFRMYYGSLDKDVSPKDATEAYTHMLKLGGNVQLIGLGNLSHVASAYAALPKTRAFIDSLTTLHQSKIK